MTEQEWFACDDPRRVFQRLSDLDSPRKLRLLACSCVRQVWVFLGHSWSRRAVEVAEEYAERQGGRAELETWSERQTSRAKLESWSERSRKAVPASGPRERHAAEAAHFATNLDPFTLMAATARHAGDAMGEAGPPVLLRLADCVFGNPFRPASVSSGWLSPTALSLASAAYEERTLPSGELDAGRLAVLSDALEEAGCTDAEMLNHLRSPGIHVRGCWAVDLILGKE